MRFDVNAITGSRTWQQARRHGPLLLGGLLLAAAAWQAAQLTWTVVETIASPPSLPPAESLTDTANAAASPESMEAIAAMHLFGTAEIADGSLVAAAADAPETRLNLKLRGVLASNDPLLSRAVISSGNDEKVYAVGATVPGGATLEAVLADRVILRRAGRLETLRLPREGVDSSISYAETEPEMEPAAEELPSDITEMREEILESPTRLAELLRYSPVLEGGTIRGYRVYPGRDRASFAQLGLQPGDIVTAINGTPLSDPGRAMEMLNNMTDQSNVVLTVERNGSTQNVTLSPSQ
ncbi:MAG TPA: type II secretion system protein GspC [Gammaproteobacteria bacterium]